MQVQPFKHAPAVYIAAGIINGSLFMQMQPLLLDGSNALAVAAAWQHAHASVPWHSPILTVDVHQSSFAVTVRLQGREQK